MSGGPRSYTFRISAEGMGEFVQDLQRAAGASDAAHQVIGRLVQSSTSLSSALVTQQEATDRAARRAAELSQANERLTASAQTTGERIRGSTTALEAMEGRAQGARRAVSDLRGAMELLGAGGVAGSLGTVTGVLGNVADLFGTGALAAGRFGTALQVAGQFALPVAAVLGGIVIATTDWSAASDRAGQSLRELRGSAVDMEVANTAYERGLRGLIQSLETAADRERRLAQEQRERRIGDIQGELATLTGQRTAAERRVAELQPIADQVAEARRIAGPDTQIAGAAGRRFADYERASEQLRTLRDQITTLESGIRDLQSVPFRSPDRAPAPAAPAAPRPVAGGRAPDPRATPIYEYAEDPRQTVFPVDIEPILARNRQAEDRARQQREEEERRSEERLAREEERRNEATAREWSRGLADATFAGLQAGFSRGEGPAQAFARILGNVVQRSLANVLADDVFMPVVRGFIGGGATGGGSLTSMLSGGGILGNVGQLSNVSSLLGGGGGLGGIAESVNGFASSLLPSVFTSTGSANIANAASLAATTPEALLAALPAGPTSAMGTSFLGSLGPMAGGFAAGSFLGSLVAGKSQARQTNAMIGAGIGALAFGPIGGIVGGIGGGLIGPGPKTNAFGFSLEAADGRFSAGGLRTTGDGAGGDQVLAQARAAAQQLNAFLEANDITVATNNRVINGRANSSDQSATFSDAVSAFRFSSRPGTSLDTLLSGRSFESPEALSNAVQWVTNTYDALAEISRPTDQWVKTLDTLNRSFEKAIDKAREYGLATDVLVASQAKAVEQATLEREVSATGNALTRSRILGGFLQQVALTNGSPQSQFGTARQQFEDVIRQARLAGDSADLSRVVQAAGTLRQANVNFNGAGQAAAGVESFIVSELRGLGARLDLPAFASDFDASISRNITRVVEGLEALKAVQASQRDELLSIRLALATSR